MGIKTKLTKKEILPFIEFSTLTPTSNGVRDTVYILDDKYILKLFEKSSMKELKEEMKLFKLLKTLPIAKVLKKPFQLTNKPAIIYQKCNGKVLKNIEKSHIKQLGKFLKQLHKLTKRKQSTNKMLFKKQRVEKLLKKLNNKRFTKIYNSLDLKLENHGIIHGDLFRDNALFYKDKLSCVIDFGEACNGDFHFDLAVVALDWCNNNKEIKLLQRTYGSKLPLKQFKQYIKLAGLYYAILRYFDKKDYKALLKRIEKL